jgi:hypothetical protein
MSDFLLGKVIGVGAFPYERRAGVEKYVLVDLIQTLVAGSSPF